jgi:hypothetical protein
MLGWFLVFNRHLQSHQAAKSCGEVKEHPQTGGRGQVCTKEGEASRSESLEEMTRSSPGLLQC